MRALRGLLRVALCCGLWLPAAAGANTHVGAVLPAAPTVPPGRIAASPPNALAAAIEARNQGDLRRAAWLYETWLGQKGGGAGVRAGAQLALGLVYLDLDDPNSASALFSKVRSSGASVAPWGAWYEALADHRRGRHSTAASECATYRKNWPTGAHADECLVLMGDAYVAAGQRGPAIGAYQAYLDAHPDSPREETLRLGIALAVSTTDPVQSIPLLQRLLLDHQYHSTGESAQRRLDELAKEGLPAALPDDGITACRLAAERKRCGYETEAWQKFEALEKRAVDDPAIAAWIEDHADQFRWGTKQYKQLAELLAVQYAAKPSAEVAWQRYRALSRGGDWKGAQAQLEDGAKNHPGSRFRGTREDLARARLLAGDYAGARDAFTALGKSGGALGREARWLAAFSAFRAGDDADALARLEPLTRGDDWTASAARYYRIRTLLRAGKTDEAKAARDALIKGDPWSWYAALLQNEDEPEASEIARAGRWPGPAAPTLPPQKTPAPSWPALATPGSGATAAAQNGIDWAALAWSGGGFAAGKGGTSVVTVGAAGSAGATLTAVPGAAPGGPPLARSWDQRPEAYVAGSLFDPAEGARLLEALGAEHADLFPDAQAAADLARGGAFDLAAPLVARMYDAIDPAVGGTAHPEITLTVAEWRQVFLLVRDHYHVARFSWGLHKGADTPEESVASWRLTFPTAEADALWRHGQRYDVDPLMALAVMRQESVYRQWALSATGAVGLMQVMPRTGARIAARMGDPSYSPDVLSDPSTNVRYGVWYLGVLLERFGGAWPLAVASYNGGPHNVSAWLAPFGDKIRMDDFVETMPYSETRDYVKKVTGWYMAYVALYGAPGDQLRIPLSVTKDDASLVNF